MVFAHARRPASRDPPGRSKDCLQKRSSPYIRKVQHTVLSVAGLKGTMSEAELHVLYARMRGGILSKARRGELAVRLPVGLVYDDKGEVILDPDTQVQQSLRLLFATFGREGSVWSAVKRVRQQGLLFPKRLFCGP